MWEYQLPALLAGGYRCVMLDRRGHGRSDVTSGGYDRDTLADDLDTLLTRLDLRDVSAIGHSMGVNETVRLLARSGGQRVGRAVFVAGITPYVGGAAGPAALRKLSPPCAATVPPGSTIALTPTSPGPAPGCRTRSWQTPSPRSCNHRCRCRPRA